MTFVRYLVIQVIAYGLDMGVFLAFVYTGLLGPVMSNALAKVAAGAFAFVTHRSFTFRLDKGKHSGRQMLRYIMLLALNVPLSSIVLGMVLFAVSHAVVAKIISDIIVVSFTYWLSKTWVFVPDVCDKSPRDGKRGVL